MRWGRKETHVEKNTLKEESYFLIDFSKMTRWGRHETPVERETQRDEK